MGHPGGCWNFRDESQIVPMLEGLTVLWGTPVKTEFKCSVSDQGFESTRWCGNLVGKLDLERAW